MKLLIEPVEELKGSLTLPPGVRLLMRLQSGALLVETSASGARALQRAPAWKSVLEPTAVGLPAALRQEHMPDVLLANKAARERLAQMRAQRQAP